MWMRKQRAYEAYTYAALCVCSSEAGSGWMPGSSTPC